MKKFTEELQQHLQLRIQEIKATGAVGFELYNACYCASRKAFRRLKEFVHKYTFKNQEEEIAFFKEVKPVFQSQLLYYMEMIQIEIRKPTVVEKKDLIRYYRKTSHHYQTVMEKHGLFMHYMRTRLTTGDHLMFVRSAEAEQIIHTDIVDLDDRFCTPASTELARSRSCEMVIGHLAELIEALKSGAVTAGIGSSKAVWTGSKVALIELAYALYASKVINHGQIDIKQVVSALEGIFMIDLGNFYRVFLNIRIRQKSRTAFIDELKDKLTFMMDEADSVV